MIQYLRLSHVLFGREYRAYVFIAALGGALRLIPELLLGGYPAGFDSMAYYPYFITSIGTWSYLDSIRSGPLFMLLMWCLWTFSKANVFLVIKAAAPIVYSGLGVAFLFFARRAMGFSRRLATTATLFLILQPVTLRVGWDLFRNELGLIFVFLTLGMLTSQSVRGQLAAGLFSILASLSHPFASILLAIGICGLLLTRSIRLHYQFQALYACSIAILIFMIWGTLLSPWQLQPPNRVTLLRDGGTIPFLDNVFKQDFRFVSGSYFDVALSVGLLLLFSTVLLVPLALRGSLRNPIIKSWIGWLSVGSFSVVIFPSAAVPVYWRWELLWVFPLAIVAALGLKKLMTAGNLKERHVLAMLFLFLAIGSLYSSGIFSYMRNDRVNTYIPGTLIESSFNLSQFQSVTSALEFINSNASTRSAVVLDERFYSVALMTLRSDLKVFVYIGPQIEGASISQLHALTSEVYLLNDHTTTYNPAYLVFSEEGVHIWKLN